MGTDYNLKKSYEQVLEGKSSKTKEPRTLKEAYEHVFEATAFYIKDMTGGGTTPPVYNGLKQVGVVTGDEAKSIQNKIKSHSITSVTDKMLTEAGWDLNNPLLNSRTLGHILFENEINTEDLNTIVENKTKLNAIVPSSLANSTEPIDIIEGVFSGIEGLIKTPNTEKQNFLNLIKDLFDKDGTIKGTNVGSGEFVLSLLTNAKKIPEKGDLVFADQTVEVKTGKHAESGAALGYAPHAMESLKATMSRFITKDYKASKPLYDYKRRFINYIEALQKQGIAPGQPSPFTEKFFNDVESLLPYFDNLDAIEFSKKVNQLFGFDLTSKSTTRTFDLNSLVDTLVKKNYVNASLVDRSPETQTILKNLLVTKNQKGAVSFLAKLTEAYKKMLSFATSGSDSTVENKLKKQEISEADDESSLTMTFKNMLVRSNFITSLEIANKETPEVVLDTIASILFEARPYTESNSDLLSGIRKALNGEYINRLKRHDMSALSALVFAIQLSEYARSEGFEYLLLVNKSSKNGLFIKAKTTFLDLLSIYEQRKSHLVFEVVFSERQGAHKISVK
jgi:hypothetical protein